MISRQDILDTAEKIAGSVRQTPLIHLSASDWSAGIPLWLKLEHLQHTGSFKTRGVFSRVIGTPVPAAGLIAASGGNHGLAVAYVAQQLGYQAEIFVPENCPPVKVARLLGYGAQVQQIGNGYNQAYTASQQRQQQTGALEVHAFNQPEVITGQGTLGLELSQQLAELDTVLVAVGGGGLIAGIAAWFAGSVKVVGVEPQGAAALSQALAVGEPVEVDIDSIAADSLGARRVGNLAFEIATNFVAQTVLVEDSAIVAAQKLLWNEFRQIVEPGGATALAALISGKYMPARDERVAVIVCGGNTDPAAVAAL